MPLPTFMKLSCGNSHAGTWAHWRWLSLGIADYQVSHWCVCPFTWVCRGTNLWIFRTRSSSFIAFATTPECTCGCHQDRSSACQRCFHVVLRGLWRLGRGWRWVCLWGFGARYRLPSRQCKSFISEWWFIGGVLADWINAPWPSDWFRLKVFRFSHFWCRSSPSNHWAKCWRFLLDLPGYFWDSKYRSWSFFRTSPSSFKVLNSFPSCNCHTTPFSAWEFP